MAVPRRAGSPPALTRPRAPPGPQVVDEVAVVPSKRMRNKIAGFVTVRSGRGPPRGRGVLTPAPASARST